MSDEKRRRGKNGGVRKLCGCARRKWPKCEHPWHFNYKFGGEHFRLSLERHIGRIVRAERMVNGAKKTVWKRDRGSLGAPIATKTDAEHEAERLKIGIRDRSLLAGAVERLQRETLTLSQLMEAYRRGYLDTHRPRSARHLDAQIRVILRSELQRLDGNRRTFGEWYVADIKPETIAQFQRLRLERGSFTSNRDLGLLRSMFNWALAQDHVDRTPFKKNGVPTIRFTHEPKRRRRLQPGESERLLAACGDHLRALVEAALETGCRKGELLSLQWSQVRFSPRAELFLPGQKTKTKGDRTVPISTRLRAILEMRRTGPDGEPHPPDAYVFGNEIGQRVKNVKRAWQRAVLKAHGCVPRYVVRTIVATDGTPRKKRTAALTRESQSEYAVIDLHFHDLRREAGSRWLDAGVPLHRIRNWLGHANISQTSTYLAADAVDDDQAMARYEAQLQRIATASLTGVDSPALPHTVRNETPQKLTGTNH